MKRQTILGVLFIIVGLALLVLVCAPVVIAIHAHAALPSLSFSLVLTGLGTALFGAWLLPSSGVGGTAASILVVAGPYIPRIPGISRVGDPVPPASEDKP
jgi:hypothetical protein